MQTTTIRTAKFEAEVPLIRALPPDDQLGLWHAMQRPTAMYEVLTLLMAKLPENKRLAFELLSFGDAMEFINAWIKAGD